MGWLGDGRCYLMHRSNVVIHLFCSSCCLGNKLVARKYLVPGLCCLHIWLLSVCKWLYMSSISSSGVLCVKPDKTVLYTWAINPSVVSQVEVWVCVCGGVWLVRGVGGMLSLGLCSTCVISSCMERVSMETEGWVQRSCECRTWPCGCWVYILKVVRISINGYGCELWPWQDAAGMLRCFIPPTVIVESRCL